MHDKVMGPLICHNGHFIEVGLEVVPSLMVIGGWSLGRDDNSSIGKILSRQLTDLLEIMNIWIVLMYDILNNGQDILQNILL